MLNFRRGSAVVAAVVVAVAGTVVTGAPASAAVAAAPAGVRAEAPARPSATPQAADTATGPAPVEQRAATMPTADALPTVQIDGVAWSQAILGNTVYVGGKFANARPAGAAPGTNLTPRANLLSYNLTTGQLNTAWAPSTNDQVLAVALSPDGSRLYVGGTFTSADGQNRYRLAAYNTATGQLVSNFKPILGYMVRSIVATNTTVYVGGTFATANGQTRNNLAAFNAADGSLTGWAPSADFTVNALVLVDNGTKIIAGGSFQNVNGAPAYGLAAIDASSGALLPWAANQKVQNAGQNAGIWSLSTDGNAVYGTGYVYGAGGNLEGAFSADPATGAINWIEDCHGDSYDSYSDRTTVYTVSHAHYCSTVGGFPQTDSNWNINQRHAIAFTAEAKGTLGNNIYSAYTNWAGNPAPAMYNWFPDMDFGKYTTSAQAAWDVTGNGEYVVMAGEFPTVNNVGQQGLVRFATKPPAPGKQGPRVTGANFTPAMVPAGAGSIRVSWPANWDRDDMTLKYTVTRNGTAVKTLTADSQFWNLPTLSFIDSGLTPGQTYSYQVSATDPDGNTVTGDPASIVAPNDPAPSAYSKQVIADGAQLYWRLGETSGQTAADRTGSNNGVGTALTRGTPGALAQDPDTATSFNGSSSTIGSSTATQAPDTFTVSAWFKTTTGSGGKIIGFGNAKTGLSGSYDRQVYMDNSGRLWFGVYPNSVKTVNTTAAYNDGRWHQVVASLGPAGMTLWVDGTKQATRSDTIAGQQYTGYWRVGGDKVGAWPNAPRSSYFAGAIDEFEVYPSVLTDAQVANHYTIGTTGPAPNQPPAAAFTSNASGLTATFDGSTSSDADGQITGYQWDFGDGTAGSTEAKPSHSYAAAGTYQVKLTVTDDKGASNSVTHPVTVSHADPTAKFTATAADLKISFDGSASTATDGAKITGYAWDFGDGSAAGTGATPSHTYATGGTYQVKLTVTDSLGAKNSITKAVAVTAGNKAPTAAFSSSADGLTATFDGSASADPDGSIASYAWDFGDQSAAGSGATVSHSYAAAGTYQVKLTVTDNSGATASVTHAVTVAAAAGPIAADNFGRTSASGWGNADTGGAWTISGGAPNASVSGNRGVLKPPAAGSTVAATLNSVSAKDIDETFQVTLDKMPTGSGVYVASQVRKSGNSYYMLRLIVKPTGQVAGYLIVSSAGAETTLCALNVPNLTYAPGMTLGVRFTVSGTPATVAGRVWDAAKAEPSTWTLAPVTDSTAATQAPGGISLLAYLSSNTTNAPVAVSYSKLLAGAPAP
ncbi:PKD domain-containing protein [Nakamurella aerolata]|uniref:PKD domain-containing protein n=1 Tax=Nakamurella aerolata TaxID=1656892 RepID=A0A849A9Q7_9ACTN|nr:PKD domain-containing protein [Nakamurella aerolata]NNG35831.1 PKD domain-containing protein [Nakamurella aerolata]